MTLSEKFVYSSSNEQVFKWIRAQVNKQTDLQNFLEIILNDLDLDTLEKVTWLTKHPLPTS